MPEPLKNMLNPKSLREFAENIHSVYNPFPVDEFIASTIDEKWESLELLARGHQIAANLRKYLPTDYQEAINICSQAIPSTDGWYCLIFPDFVEMYGQDAENWDTSVAALELFTQYGSSEFAVRPFIIKNEERMMTQMYAWSKHKNEHVRRLASEGCRPALPWAQALPKYKKDPSPVLPILEQLKTDPSAYVRKSVANNLNDISKTHPDLVAGLAKDWYGKNKDTDWIIKHGCRTLLKQGNSDVLAIFGYHNAADIDVSDFAVAETSVTLGSDLTFSFAVQAKEATKIRLEYGIDYVKANGKRNRKIFQISETALKAHEKKLYTKTHSLADLSTRKHYLGTHSVTLIVNGTERGTLDFELTN